ncbi:MAG: GDP-L-fucose synthase [Planctomycetes bacterium]|nr:GDP-L-fucose synthase [Planctomycetota bacterium]
MMLNPADQRILVTGGAGFLGRHLCELLREHGCRNLFTPRSADYDLVDRAAVRRMLATFKPSLVIHLAARVGGIGANRDNPGLFFHDNLAMGLHLIEESRLAGVGKLVQLGTVCAYPKFAPVPFREDALWDGFPEETNAPYGIAKKSLLVMLQAYRAQYGFRGVYLLPVNLYGPGDNFDAASSHVIPALIRKFCAGGDRVEVWGDGTPTREFLYVRDCAQGIIAACERYDGAAPINLGSGEEISIRELALKIRQCTGSTAELVFDPGKPNGQPRRMLDTSRAELEFGWQAATPFDEGLRKTVAWWQAQAAEQRR